MFGRPTVAFVSAVGVWSASMAPVHAYNISAKGRVHERITKLAEDCAALKPAPERCTLPADAREFDRVPWREGELWEAVRWPDDPTRQGNIGGAIKFAVNAGLGRCERHLQPGRPFAGLLCNSHFGRLQFMHAMASADGEDRAGTRGLVLAWTKFAFGVASGRTDASAPFCKTVRAAGAPLADALAPADFPFCEAGAHPAWKVRTIFVLRCRNPVSSTYCSEAIGDQADLLARRNAKGALLHLIQDSYSRSHTDRGSGESTTGPYLAAVDCRPVLGFRLYALNKKKHGAADKLPAISPSCRGEGEILDPVTASARMLLSIGAGDEEGAVALIDRQVLGGSTTT